MGETPTTAVAEMEALSPELIRSRLKELSLMLDDALGTSEDLLWEPKRFLEDFSRNLLVVSKDPDVAVLRSDDLEVCIEQLEKELNSVEEANMKASSEIDALEVTVSTDLAKFDREVEALSCLFEITDSKGMFSSQSIPTEKLSLGGFLPNSMHASEEKVFKVMELNHHIEKTRCNLTTLEERHHILKRLDTIATLEDVFCGVKCIQYDDKYIRLLLRTPIPSVNSSTFQKKFDFLLKPLVLDHELVIEVADTTMGLKNVEIFPSDVHIDGIMDHVKSSRCLPIPMVGSPMEWLIRQIQQRIVFCTIRRLLVKGANKSRFSFVYSDAHEMITTKLAGDLDVSIKLSHGWPLSNTPLILMSLKYSDSNSKSVSASLLCKFQEQANNLDIQTHQDLLHFVDAIEKIVKEVLPEH